MNRYVIFIYIVCNKLIVRIWGNNMKKYIIFICLSILVLGQISAIAGLDLNNRKELDTTFEVTNNGNGLYFGKIRSYITEIESRWNNYDGVPYHYGFLDFAINKIIFLLPGQTKSLSVEWDGKEDHN